MTIDYNPTASMNWRERFWLEVLTLVRFNWPKFRSMPTVAAKVRYAWSVARVYENERCDSCGRGYYEGLGETWWWTDDDLWRTVVGTAHGTRCPRCFTSEARAKGIAVSWQPIVEKP